MSTNLTGIWQKASASGIGNCVEVRLGAGTVDLRDSKNPDAGHLSVAPAVYRNWIASLKDDAAVL